MAQAKTPYRVAVIDDDARVRAALTRLLCCTPGVQVVAGANGENATLDALLAEGIDVAVVDVRLPHPAAGLAAIATLSRHVPVIGTSASSSLREPALQAGAIAFCDKDGDTDTLLAAVHSALTLPDEPRRPWGTR